MEARWESECFSPPFPFSPTFYCAQKRKKTAVKCPHNNAALAKRAILEFREKKVDWNRAPKKEALSGIGASELPKNDWVQKSRRFTSANRHHPTSHIAKSLLSRGRKILPSLLFLGGESKRVRTKKKEALNSPDRAAVGCWDTFSSLWLRFN